MTTKTTTVMTTTTTTVMTTIEEGTHLQGHMDGHTEGRPSKEMRWTHQKMFPSNVVVLTSHGYGMVFDLHRDGFSLLSPYQAYHELFQPC